MLWGYVSSAVRRVPQYENAELRNFVRRYQHKSLLIGKSAAARKMTEERAHVWRAAHGAPSP